MKRPRLLCIAGLSPQTVTETLYALHREGGIHAMPESVHIITTSEGRRRIHLGLLDTPDQGGRGHFQRFCQDYGIPPGHIRLDDSTIHVIQNEDGTPLADIVSGPDNDAAADTIVEHIRLLTQDENPLHVSLAGGRKTMGFFAGYALSLYGRAEDRLSHVLVNGPFEAHPDFYYPPPQARALNMAGRNDLASTADAVVQLAYLPFVRLRHGLPPALKEGRVSYGTAVAAASRAFQPPHLEIDIDEGVVRAADIVIAMPPAELAFYLWFARRAIQCREGLLRPIDGIPNRQYACEYLDAYDLLRAPSEGTHKRYRLGMSHQDFDERKSRVNTALTNALNQNTSPYHIVGESRPKYFFIRLHPDQIRITGLK